jgi:hypothetical protein
MHLTDVFVLCFLGILFLFGTFDKLAKKFGWIVFALYLIIFILLIVTACRY